MDGRTIGFIGGGRVVKIILGGLKQAGKMPRQVVVSDIDTDVLRRQKTEFPEIVTAENDNREAAGQDIVFLAVHPQVIGDVLGAIRPYLNPDSFIISLAPRLTLARISEMTGGFQRVARMVPNAPSIINEGYNPVAFYEGTNERDRGELIGMLRVLGECVEVSEEKLEACAILFAMGPTYLWFQLYELHDIGRSFGLTDRDISDGLSKMVVGAVKTMYESGMPPEEVMDLVAVKPLKEHEESIRDIYRMNLEAIYMRLKGS